EGSLGAPPRDNSSRSSGERALKKSVSMDETGIRTRVSTVMHCGVSLLTITLFAWSALWAAKAPPLTLRVDAGRLSLTADRVLLSRILSDLGRLGHVSILVESGLRPQLARAEVTLSLDKVPVEQGLRRLLRESDLVLVYAGTDLLEVRVYADRGSAQLSNNAMTRWTAGASARVGLTKATASARGDSGEVDVQDMPAPRRDEAAVLDDALAALLSEQQPDALGKALDTLLEFASVPLEPLIQFAMSDREAEYRTQVLELLNA